MEEKSNKDEISDKVFYMKQTIREQRNIQKSLSSVVNFIFYFFTFETNVQLNFSRSSTEIFFNWLKKCT